MIEAVEYQYIETNTALAEACGHWAGASFLAIDTEFIRRDTFYPIAGLLQVGAEGRCVLIDPLSINDWQPLIELFRNESVVKVIHSCSEDLEVFQRLLGCLPKPLLDTQPGAALAGLGVGLSYQNLVLECLGIHVDKGETRSDWLQRPLTASQRDYAALDVLYLQRVYPLLCDKLSEQGRLEWWREDCDKMLAQAENPQPISEYYQRVKGVWKLRSGQRRGLKALCEWREHEARRRDIPRGRVLKDPICFEIARRQPRDLATLSRIRDIPGALVRRDGEHILDILAAAADNAAEGEPPSASQQPLNGDQNRMLKRLRDCAAEIAEREDISVEVLARKRDFEELIRNRELPESLRGWRESLVGPPLLNLVCKKNAGALGQGESMATSEES